MSKWGGRWRRLVRWVVVGTGPLKRGTDRVEMVTRLLVLVAVVLALPAAVGSGMSLHGRLVAAAQEQAAQRQQVKGIVLTQPPTATDTPAADGPATADVPVRWVTASGAARVATVPVPDTVHAGDVVTVWLTRSGDPTTPPASAASATSDSVSVGLAVLLAIPMLAWLVHALVRRLLDVRRARQWQAGWQAVEPVWAPHHR